MSAHKQGGSAAPHSLAFRVMRLCRPSFQTDDAVLRLDPSDLFAGEDLFTDPSLSPQKLLLGPAASATAAGGSPDFTFRHRFLLQNPTEALPLSGLLILPQSLGAIYLRETFCSYISINNSSSFEARDVVIKGWQLHEEGRLKELVDSTLEEYLEEEVPGC